MLGLTVYSAQDIAAARPGAVRAHVWSLRLNWRAHGGYLGVAAAVDAALRKAKSLGETGVQLSLPVGAAAGSGASPPAADGQLTLVHLASNAVGHDAVAAYLTANSRLTAVVEIPSILAQTALGMVSFTRFIRPARLACDESLSVELVRGNLERGSRALFTSAAMRPTCVQLKKLAVRSWPPCRERGYGWQLTRVATPSPTCSNVLFSRW